MLYPSRLTTCNLDTCSIPLYQPDPEAITAAFLKAGGNTTSPYWARVWPASLALCRALERHPEWVRHQTVLELAAGLGLPSLLTARWAKSVHCTDAAAEALPYMEASVQANVLSNVTCARLHWQDALIIPCDVVLMSDVNYEPAVFDELYGIINGFLQKETAVILSSPQRITARAFFERLLPFCRERFNDTVEGTDVAVWVLTAP
jgi:predicted nicotinamide N-methyase